LLTWRSSKKADDSRFSFLDFPLELCEQVYGCLLVYDGNVQAKPREREQQTLSGHYDIWSCSRLDFGIFEATRQIAAEAKKVFYRDNTFDLGLTIF
jgi:hypothetical protein